MSNVDDLQTCMTQSQSQINFFFNLPIPSFQSLTHKYQIRREKNN